jgi:2'-5' RNA ligase
VILFAAIMLPDKIAGDIVREQKGVSGARWVSREKLHITLGYFGEVDADHAEMLDVELGKLRMGSFELQLAGSGHFGKTEPHAIWVGVRDSSGALDRLHTHCRHAARRADITMDARKYTPHVTTAYMKPRSPLDRIVSYEQRLADWETRPFLVDEFQLLSSHAKRRGPNLYREEANVPLLGEGVAP